MGENWGVWVTEQQLTEAFAEWERRFREEPERFWREADLASIAEGEVGSACARYLLEILGELETVQ